MGYGYDDYGYGGRYYSVPGPGGHLDARTYLDGPGTHAYLQQGQYSSYAYEGQNGSIFEQNTTTFKGGYEQSTSYDYSNASYRYGHIADFSYHNPPLYHITGIYGYSSYQAGGSYGSYVGSYGPGEVTSYNVSDIETHTDGAYSTVSFQNASETTLADGYYHTGYSSRSGEYLNGHQVPGSVTSDSTTSYGYLNSYAT
jgi:hypothetical protein